VWYVILRHANRVRVLDVRDEDRSGLERRVRSKAAPAGDVQRARIVLSSAEGCCGVEIAERVGCWEPTVIRWRTRYGWLGWRTAAGGCAPVDHAGAGVGHFVVHGCSASCERRALGMVEPAAGPQSRGRPCHRCPYLARYQLETASAGGLRVLTDPELGAKVATSLGFIWIHLSGLWWCAWTRSPRSSVGPRAADAAGASRVVIQP
jgi:hypothetical protein